MLNQNKTTSINRTQCILMEVDKHQISANAIYSKCPNISMSSITQGHSNTLLLATADKSLSIQELHLNNQKQKNKMMIRKGYLLLLSLLFNQPVWDRPHILPHLLVMLALNLLHWASPLLTAEAYSSYKSLTSGSRHNCIIIENARGIKCWGDNSSGQLGYGDNSTRGDDPADMGVNLPIVNIGRDAFPSSLSLGGSHSCALFENGMIKCWGYNAWGQLGLGDLLTRGTSAQHMGNNLPFIDFGSGNKILQLGSDNRHNCVLFQGGNVSCFGYNKNGELGLEDTNNRGGEVGDMGKKVRYVDFGLPNGDNITSLHMSSSAWHTCVLINKGQRAKCWGYNFFGQLGYNDINNRGDDKNEMGMNLPFIDVGKDQIENIFVGFSHTCVVLSSFTTRCWGSNGFGQLGIGNTLRNQPGSTNSPTEWGLTVKPSQISIGDSFMCGLLDGGRIKCFGKNDSGQLGQGDKASRGSTLKTIGEFLPFVDLGLSQVVKQITSGVSHTCVLLEGNRVKCWGASKIAFLEGGYLGLGNIEDYGDEEDEMGDNLPFVSIEGEEVNPVALAIGVTIGVVSCVCCTFGIIVLCISTPARKPKAKVREGFELPTFVQNTSAEINILNGEPAVVSLSSLQPEKEKEKESNPLITDPSSEMLPGRSLDSAPVRLPSDNRNRKCYIYVSYSTFENNEIIQGVVKQIREQLNSKGFVDYELTRSGGEATKKEVVYLIQDSIRQSEVVLMIATDTYFHCPNSLIELYFAMKMQKPILRMKVAFEVGINLLIKGDESSKENHNEEMISSPEKDVYLELEDVSIDSKQIIQEFNSISQSIVSLKYNSGESTNIQETQIETLVDIITTSKKEVQIV